MNAERILGFVFLFLGAGIIVLSLYSGLQAFGGHMQVPEIFKVSALGSSGQQVPGNLSSLSPEALQGQIQSLLSDQVKSMIPANAIPQILNLFSWSMFLGLAMFGGGQIAGIGIKLLKR